MRHDPAAASRPLGIGTSLTHEQLAPTEVATPPARLPRGIARDVDAGSFLQTLLISAVVSVLVTRLYLELTGFPRIGGGGLHVAHMLWGGLLMLVALVLLLSLLGKLAKRASAVIGGLGFGLFVDELGKFVTSDNNYFFQPTIALIYVLFIGLFMAFRTIERRSLSKDELLVNAADMLREVILGGATRAEIVRARRLLDRSGYTGQLADALEEAIASAARAPERRTPWLAFAARAWRTYDDLIASRWFQRALVLVFVAQAVIGLLAVGIVGVINSQVDPRPPLMLRVEALPFEGAGLAASLLSLALVLLGIARLPVSRVAAYRWFERSIVVSIFFTQVILFWQDQLAALGGLAWDLVLYTCIRLVIRQEEARLLLEMEHRPSLNV